MSLGFRIIVSILAMFCLMLLLEAAVDHFVVKPRIALLERQKTQQDMHRFLASINRERQYLDLLLLDWSSWDDTYDFVESSDKDYIISNLDISTFRDGRLSLIAFYNKADDIVWGFSYDRDKDALAPLPPLPLDALRRLANTSQEDYGATAYLNSASGPLLVAARPILTTQGDGPAMGLMVMGRSLNAYYFSHIGERLMIDVVTWPAQAQESLTVHAREEIRKAEGGAAAHLHPNANIGHAFATLRDITGKPLVILQTITPLRISSFLSENDALEFFMRALTIMVVLTALYLALRYSVLTPIRSLTNRVRKMRYSVIDSGADPADVAISHNELQTLSDAMDTLWASLSTTKNDLLEQAYYSGMSQTAAGVLHNVRNALNPAMSELEKLRESLHDLPLDEMRTASVELQTHPAASARRRDLEEYLDLCTEESQETVAAMRSGVQRCLDRFAAIETILATFEQHGKAAPLKQTIFIRECMQDALASIPLSLQNAITLEPLQGDGDSLALADKATLTQVLANLLANAAEASVGRPQGVRIQPLIDSTESPDDARDGGMLSVILCDDGPGFAPEALDKAFDRGFTTKERGFAGLGLHWCSIAMSAMGGSITAANRPDGQGACITLLLKGAPKKILTDEAAP